MAWSWPNDVQDISIPVPDDSLSPGNQFEVVTVSLDNSSFNTYSIGFSTMLAAVYDLQSNPGGHANGSFSVFVNQDSCTNFPVIRRATIRRLANAYAYYLINQASSAAIRAKHSGIVFPLTPEILSTMNGTVPPRGVCGIVRFASADRVSTSSIYVPPYYDH